MYLAHINFRPADDGRLVDSVVDDYADVVVRQVLPPFFTPSESYLAYRDAIVADPSRHRTLTKNEPIDPELVLTMKAKADAEGWAHALQVHPDQTADFVSFRPSELNYVRSAGSRAAPTGCARRSCRLQPPSPMAISRP